MELTELRSNKSAQIDPNGIQLMLGSLQRL